MNTRLKVICVLFAVVYLFIIADNIWQYFWSPDINFDSIADPNWKDNFGKRWVENLDFFYI